MHISKHFHTGLISVVILVGTAGLLSPLASQAQFGPLAPLEQLTESGCVTKPVWDEIIDGHQRFVAKMDGAAYCDRQTGLVWETEPSVESLGWPEALEHCLNRTVGTNGQLGWRLPSIAELGTLVDKNSSGCDIHICLPDRFPFRNVEGEYWSATTHKATQDLTWTVDFDRGEVYFEDNEVPLSPHRAWCVRGASDSDTY